jgi:hypothetical protein
MVYTATVSGVYVIEASTFNGCVHAGRHHLLIDVDGQDGSANDSRMKQNPAGRPPGGVPPSPRARRLAAACQTQWMAIFRERFRYRIQ